MPKNKDAFIRYMAIDRLLQKGGGSLMDLISAVCIATNRKISQRTVQMDIQEMRQNQDLKLCAPIVYVQTGRGRFTKGNGRTPEAKCLHQSGIYKYQDPGYTLLGALRKNFYNKEEVANG